MSGATIESLAIKGGKPTLSYDLPTWPSYSDDETKAVLDVLQSGKVNYWTGSKGKKFESEFANYLGVKHAIALANGSVALEIALATLGIGEGDEVIVTSRTFVASASSICLKGAVPIFADVHRESQNVTSDSVESCITSKTKAIILVHLAGWPCDMDPILKIAKDNNLKIIEDCAQAHGSKYKDSYVGTFGDVATFSFCQDKIISTGGEGGMLVTNSERLWRSAWEYKDHGKKVECLNNVHVSSKGMFQWVHDSFGTNLRMTEMQATIGLVQLDKLNKWVGMRAKYAGMLNECFSKISALRVTLPNDDIIHAYYKYYVFVRLEQLNTGWGRNEIIHALQAEGVSCYMGSCSEVYKEKSFVSANLSPKEDLKVAKELGETSLMFNVHPTLEVSDIEKVCEAVKKVFYYASA